MPADVPFRQKADLGGFRFRRSFPQRRTAYRRRIYFRHVYGYNAVSVSSDKRNRYRSFDGTDNSKTLVFFAQKILSKKRIGNVAVFHAERQRRREDRLFLHDPVRLSV